MKSDTDGIGTVISRSFRSIRPRGKDNRPVRWGCMGSAQFLRFTPDRVPRPRRQCHRGQRSPTCVHKLLGRWTSENRPSARPATAGRIIVSPSLRPAPPHSNANGQSAVVDDMAAVFVARSGRALLNDRCRIAATVPYELRGEYPARIEGQTPHAL